MKSSMRITHGENMTRQVQQHMVLLSATRAVLLLCSSVSCHTQHLIDAVTSEAFGDELPLGIISLDGASQPQTLILIQP